MKIVFATNNKNKLSEIREILGGGFEVMSLAEIGCHEDIPETGDTLLDNAVQSCLRGAIRPSVVPRRRARRS